MRPVALTVSLFFAALLHGAPARADWANVAKAAEVLDFNLPPNAQRAGNEGGLAALDIDGDGQVSRAEAAGNADVTLAFDRADRNRNGRISTAEWQRYEKWQERRAKAREARMARNKAKESASTGATTRRAP